MSIISGSVGRALWIVCILFITMLNMGLTGFLIGINSKTSSQAINRALVVIIGFLILTVLPHYIIRYAGMNVVIFPPYLIEAIMLINPFYAVALGIEKGFLFILTQINLTFILIISIVLTYKYRFDINIRILGMSGLLKKEVPADVA
jgi:hypothetical protein